MRIQLNPARITAVQALRQYYQAHHAWPTRVQWTQWRTTAAPAPMPSYHQIESAWRTWWLALAAAGAPAELLFNRQRFHEASLSPVQLTAFLASIPDVPVSEPIPISTAVRTPQSPEGEPRAVVSALAIDSGTRRPPLPLGPKEILAMQWTVLAFRFTVDGPTWRAWFRASPAHPSSGALRFPSSWPAQIRRPIAHAPDTWMTYLRQTWLAPIIARSLHQWPVLSDALAFGSQNHWPPAFCYVLALNRMHQETDETTVLNWLTSLDPEVFPPVPCQTYPASRRWAVSSPAIPTPIQRPDGRRPRIIIVGHATHKQFCRRLVEHEFRCRLRFYEGQDEHAPKRFPHAEGVILAINQTSHEFDAKLHRQFDHTATVFLKVSQGGQIQFRQAMRQFARFYSPREEAADDTASV